MTDKAACPVLIVVGLGNRMRRCAEPDLDRRPVLARIWQAERQRRRSLGDAHRYIVTGRDNTDGPLLEAEE